VDSGLRGAHMELSVLEEEEASKVVEETFRQLGLATDAQRAMFLSLRPLANASAPAYILTASCSSTPLRSPEDE
jgi:hypothetical protein